MSDQPFGFSQPDDDPDRRKREGGDPFGGAGPFGFAAGGFDPAALGQMLSQFGQMLSGMGSAMATPGQGFAGAGKGGAVNYDLAKNMARQQLGSFTPVSEGERAAVGDAVHLADLWLDEVTTLPSGTVKAAAWTPVDWLENTMGTWPQLCDPIADQMGSMWVQGLPQEARQMIGPMAGMLKQVGGVAFGSQLGQGLGHLSKEVLTSTDIGLPLGPVGTSALLPEAVATFAKGLDLPHREVVVFLAAREAAHQRLYSHVPWLRQRILATVEEYARGIRIDFSAIEEAARGFDPSMLGNPAEIEKILQQGAFEPQTTPEQKAALERLETLLALIEGWVESVVEAALGGRLPGTGALTETMRRRRASGGPAEQTFANLVGLQLRPRRVREAAQLWKQLAAFGGTDKRDGLWSHPDLLPGASDLDDPALFVESVVGGGTSFEDAFAELERTTPTQAPPPADSDDKGAEGSEGSEDEGEPGKG